MKKCNNQNRAVELVFEKKLGWFTRIGSCAMCIAGILLILASLSRVWGSIAIPAWVIIALFFAILTWMFMPIQFQVFLNTEPFRSVLTHIRIGSMAVRQREILYDRIEIRHGPVGVVFDEENIQVKTVLCIHGENSVVICNSWAKWLFTIYDDDIRHIYRKLCNKNGQ